MSAVVRNLDVSHNKDGVFRLQPLRYAKVPLKELRLVLLETDVPIIGELKAVFEGVEAIYAVASDADRQRILEEIASVAARKDTNAVSSGSGAAKRGADASPQESLRDAELPRVPAPLDNDITPEQYRIWQHVHAAIARVNRARPVSPEKAAEQRVKGAKRSSDYRSRMSPEKAEEYRVKAREHMRLKRESGKPPAPS